MPIRHEASAALTGLSTPVSRPKVDEERRQTARDKRQALEALPEKNLSVRRAQQFINRWCNSYERIFEVFTLMYRLKSRADRLKLLGMNWKCSDNVGRYAHEIRCTIGTEGPILPMMNARERRAYDKLPEEVTIYRGCDRKRLDGMSWSLKRKVAERFPFLTRYKAEDPVLITATVLKSDVLAVFLGRKEWEIVTFKAKRVKTEDLAGASRSDSSRT